MRRVSMLIASLVAAALLAGGGCFYDPDRSRIAEDDTGADGDADGDSDGDADSDAGGPDASDQLPAGFGDPCDDDDDCTQEAGDCVDNPTDTESGLCGVFCDGESCPDGLTCCNCVVYEVCIPDVEVDEAVAGGCTC